MYFLQIRMNDSTKPEKQVDKFEDEFGTTYDIYKFPNFRLYVTPQTFKLEKVIAIGEGEEKSRYFHTFYVGKLKSFLFFVVEFISMPEEIDKVKKYSFLINGSDSTREIDDFLDKITKGEEDLEHFHDRMKEIALSERKFGHTDN